MNFINNILWGSVLIYLLLGTGIYFTLRTRFIQLRHFSHMFSVLKNSNKSDSAGISSFQALCTTLAARVGTGNLTGVAIALTAGGPGAIFWMWVVAFIGMATSFVESSLAQLYKPKTITATTAAARPTTWKRASACAGWACCSPSS
jgi:Na+/alanine symporter